MTIQYKISIIIIALVATTFTHGQDIPPVCAESVETYGVSGYNDSEYIWAVEGGSVKEGDGTDTVTIQWGYKTGTYQFEVLEITSHNCSNVPSKADVVIRAPYVDLGWDFRDLCAGDSIVLDPYIEYYDNYSYEWIVDNDTTVSSQYIAKESELVSIHVIANDGCERSDTISITKNDLPVVNLGADPMVCAIEGGYVVDLGNIGTDYQWSSSLHDENGRSAYGDSPVQEILPSTQEFDTVIAIVTDYNGCVNSDTMLVLPCNIDALFNNMPNTITPNGDNVNDEWDFWIRPDMDRFNLATYFPDAVLEIFDRQGRMVFRTENAATELWDGKSKGRALPMDAYYFVLNLNFLDAQPIVGTVNIIK